MKQLVKQQINYDEIVRGRNLQPDIVKHNFKLFDNLILNKNKVHNQLVSLNSIKNLTSQQLKLQKELMLKHSMFEEQFFNMVQEDTMYSYALFKDEDNKPFMYTAYQDAISQCVHDFTHNCHNRFILFKASNQIGKSAYLCSKAVKIAMTEENKNVVMVSRSLPQSQFLLAQIKQTLNNSEFANTWRSDLGDTANTTVLTFEFKRHGRVIVNRIICAPAGEGLLGFPVHYLFLDELDFYEKAKLFFWKVAFPRTKKTKGQIICFSNPNPDISRSGSILWELWNGDLFKRKFEFNFLDAPWNTKEEFDLDKRNSPSHIFASTHMGIFSEEGGSFFSHKEVQDMLQREWNNTLPIVDKPVYIALDLGKMNDQTILGIGTIKDPKDDRDKYMDLDIRYTEEFPLKTSYSDILKRLKELIQYYEDNFHGVAGTGYDSTGQKTFGDFLVKEGISAQGVDFSAKLSNKTQLYNDFKLMAENRKIKVVYTRKCETQLSELMLKQTETKKLKAEARTENIHDDYCDMIAIMIHISVTPGRITPGVSILSRGKREPDEEEDDITYDEDGNEETWYLG